MKILIASSNSGKIDEFQSILKDFEVIPQKHLNIEDVEELAQLSVKTHF